MTWITKHELKIELDRCKQRIEALTIEINTINIANRQYKENQADYFCAEKNKVTGLEKNIAELEKRIESQQDEFKQAVRYLEFTIENPPKYQPGDKVKTFEIYRRKFTCFETESGGSSDWGHGYSMECTITGEVTEKYFSEKQIAEIIKKK